MMGEVTGIEWTDHTASPWHGCEHATLPDGEQHPGCLNCYAERQSLRNPGVLGVWGENGTRVKSKSFINNLRRWNEQGKREGRKIRVFPSICDPFEDRPELTEWREEMFQVADECPWIVLLLLTKRPQNILRMWPNVCRKCGVSAPNRKSKYCGDGSDKDNAHMWHHPSKENICVGTSVSDQKSAIGVHKLLQCRHLSPVLFLSCEPLIGPIDLRNIVYYSSGSTERSINALTGRTWELSRDGGGGIGDTGLKVDWVIIGGESGPKSRPNDLEWTRLIIEQCKNYGVACFHKQAGSSPSNGMGPLKFKESKGGDPTEWPEALRVRQFPEVSL